MQPDLLGLEISRGELRHLTGLDPDDVFRPSVMRDKSKRLGFFANEMLVALALTPIIVGGIYSFLILPTIGSSIPLALFLLICVPVMVIAGRWLWRLKSGAKTLASLLDEIDEYHAVIQAIDINDQLTSSGNSQTNINDREKVISALELIREDLVRALKTERILRDNKKLLAGNQELLINNLANVQALEVSTQAGEYAQLLNQSLQIALDVQAQLKQIHGTTQQ
ncbi:MAG: hypothetical protein AAF378_01930 [Cyanobacteria bacterium P01_A01_bin.84]